MEVFAVHPGTCAICGYPATHFSHDPSCDIVATCCAQHDDKMLDMMAQGEIEVSDQFYYNAAVNMLLAGGISESQNACGEDVRALALVADASLDEARTQQETPALSSA